MTKTWQTLLYGVLIGFLGSGLLWIVSSQPHGESIKLIPPPTPRPLMIYINGAVQKGGLYNLPSDSRLSELIDLAGGLEENADISSINLARPLNDGEKIIIPTSENEAEDIQSNKSKLIATPNPFPLDINLANVEQLDTLPGIGEKKANQIIEYREKYGFFKKIEDIQNVPGIGPGLFSQIQNLIIIK